MEFMFYNDGMDDLCEEHGEFGKYNDPELEEKKYWGLLYIHLHKKKLLKNEDYKKAYIKLLDESIRRDYYMFTKKILLKVDNGYRNDGMNALDADVMDKEDEINWHKDDAIFIMNWIKEGKSLIL